METVSQGDKDLFDSKAWNTIKILHQGEIWKLTSPSKNIYQYENTRVNFR